MSRTFFSWPHIGRFRTNIGEARNTYSQVIDVLEVVGIPNNCIPFSRAEYVMAPGTSTQRMISDTCGRWLTHLEQGAIFVFAVHFEERRLGQKYALFPHNFAQEGSIREAGAVFETAKADYLRFILESSKTCNSIGIFIALELEDMLGGCLGCEERRDMVRRMVRFWRRRRGGSCKAGWSVSRSRGKGEHE
jgi:hypothetical protein